MKIDFNNYNLINQATLFRPNVDHPQTCETGDHEFWIKIAQG